MDGGQRRDERPVAEFDLGAGREFALVGELFGLFLLGGPGPEPPRGKAVLHVSIVRRFDHYDAWLTVDMLKSAIRSGGIAVRVK